MSMMQINNQKGNIQLDLIVFVRDAYYFNAILLDGLSYYLMPSISATSLLCEYCHEYFETLHCSACSRYL